MPCENSNDANNKSTRRMKNKVIKNFGASNRDKLINLSMKTGRDYNALLRQFFQERFLYRLSKSSYREKLILKGALLLVSHNISMYRPTKDIDFLGRAVQVGLDECEKIISEITAIDVEDGVIFDSQNLKSEIIKEEADYSGVRISVPYKMDTIIGNISIDISYGDKIVKGPIETDYPPLIDLQPPKLLVYSLESSIAEKIESIVKLNLVTSRMKDFYDILFIAGNKTFESTTLREAIETTFHTRETILRDRKSIYSDKFKSDKIKQQQWSAFLTKNKLDTEKDFIIIIEMLEKFIEPLFTSNVAQSWNSKKWKWE